MYGLKSLLNEIPAARIEIISLRVVKQEVTKTIEIKKNRCPNWLV